MHVEAFADENRAVTEWVQSPCSRILVRVVFKKAYRLPLFLVFLDNLSNLGNLCLYFVYFFPIFVVATRAIRPLPRLLLISHNPL